MNKNLLFSLTAAFLGGILIALAVVHYFHLSTKTFDSVTFNNIATPLATLFSAVLLFYALKSQREAQNTQATAISLDNSKWQFETFTKLFDDMKKSFEALTTTINRDFNDGSKEQTFTGSQFIAHVATDYLAMNKLIDGHSELWYLDPLLTQITFFIDDFQFLAMYIHRSNMPNKAHFRSKVLNFYTEYLETELELLYRSSEKREVAEKFRHSYAHLTGTMKVFSEIQKTKVGV